MPQIKTFTAPALGLQPTETGIEATAQTARRIGMFYNQAGQAIENVGQRIGSTIKGVGNVVDDYVTHQQVSHGAATLAQLTDNLSTQWNNTVSGYKDPDGTQHPGSDPNDPSTAAKFRETVLEPALEQFKTGFNTQAGQNWAEQRVEALRNHMFVKTAADMATKAKDAIAVNAEQIKNGLSGAAQRDPGATGVYMDQAKDLVHGLVASNPNLKGADASHAEAELLQKVQETIARSGLISHINKTGEIPQWAYSDRFKGFIDGAEMNTAEKIAKAQQKANLLTDKQLEAYRNQKLTDKAHESLSKSWTANVTFDDNGKPTIKPGFFKDIMNIEQTYPGKATERSKAMIDWAQKEQREKRETIVTDADTHAELLDGLFKTDKPTTDVDILTAAAKNKLDPHDTSVLLNLQKALEEKPIKGPLWAAAMDAAKANFGDSDKGKQHYAAFIQNFVPQYLKLDKAGQLPPNALNPNDPDSLISQAMRPLDLSPKEKMMGHLLKRLGAGGDVSDNMLGALTGDNKEPSARTTLPPPEKRVAGNVYKTERGNMRWTGTGWLDPSIEWKKK